MSAPLVSEQFTPSVRMTGDQILEFHEWGGDAGIVFGEWVDRWGNPYDGCSKKYHPEKAHLMRNEIRILRHLFDGPSGRYIPRLFAVDNETNTLYMEALPGLNFDHMLSPDSLFSSGLNRENKAMFVRIVEALAITVDSINSDGVLHADGSTSNYLFSAETGADKKARDFVYGVDFTDSVIMCEMPTAEYVHGIARPREGVDMRVLEGYLYNSDRTILEGKEGYMPIEAYLGLFHPKSDIAMFTAIISRMMLGINEHNNMRGANPIDILKSRFEKFLGILIRDASTDSIPESIVKLENTRKGQKMLLTMAAKWFTHSDHSSMRDQSLDPAIDKAKKQIKQSLAQSGLGDDRLVDLIAEGAHPIADERPDSCMEIVERLKEIFMTKAA